MVHKSLVDMIKENVPGVVEWYERTESDIEDLYKSRSMYDYISCIQKKKHKMHSFQFHDNMYYKMSLQTSAQK